jgi:hypothetical protein
MHPWMLGDILRVYLRASNSEVWATEKSSQPTLNSRNTQSSNRQLHTILVPVRQLETCPGYTVQYFQQLSWNPGLQALISGSSSCFTCSTRPSDAPGNSQRERASLPGAVVLSVAWKPAVPTGNLLEVPVLRTYTGSTGLGPSSVFLASPPGDSDAGQV